MIDYLLQVNKIYIIKEKNIKIKSKIILWKYIIIKK